MSIFSCVGSAWSTQTYFSTNTIVILVSLSGLHPVMKRLDQGFCSVPFDRSSLHLMKCSVLGSKSHCCNIAFTDVLITCCQQITLRNGQIVLRFIESAFSLPCLKFSLILVRFSVFCVTKQQVFFISNVVCKAVQVLCFDLVISIALTDHEFCTCSFQVLYRVSVTSLNVLYLY